MNRLAGSLNICIEHAGGMGACEYHASHILFETCCAAMETPRAIRSFCLDVGSVVVWA